MRLSRRQTRVHIIQIRREICLRLGTGDGVIQSRNKGLDLRGEGGPSIAGVAIVLENPE